MKPFERVFLYLCVFALAGAGLFQNLATVRLGHEVSSLKKDVARLERNVLGIAVETGLADVFELKSAKPEEQP